VSTSPTVNTAVINANNILNQQGGLISTVLPASGLPGVSGAIPGLNLSLNAIQNIVNAGTIMSAGNLSLTAGGSITNALPAGATGVSPVMQALGNVNLQAASIVNQGLIASQLSNVNFATAALQNSGAIRALSGSVAIQNLIGNTLNVNNALGTISARDN